MVEVTASGLAAQRFLHGMRSGQLDALAEAGSEVVVLTRRLMNTKTRLVTRSTP